MAVTVSDSAELIAALRSATGGERIELLAGDYESVTLKDYKFDIPVTITSVEADAPTIFGGRMRVMDSEGLNFEDLHFKLADDVPASWAAQFAVVGSEDVSITNVALEGRIATTDDGPAPEDVTPENYTMKVVADYAFGLGFSIAGSTDVTIDNVDISAVRIGVKIYESEGFELVNSHLHDIRSDGVNIAGSSDVRIADNLFESFHPFTSYEYPFSDHPDFIQYWGTNGAGGIHDLEIAGNLFLQGTGGTTQAIYGRMNNNSGDLEDITFTGLSIHDNLINTSHPNALLVSDWHDVEVYNNTLLPAPPPPGAPITTDGLPRILVTTDARPIDGEYDLTRGILPENVMVADNLVVGKKDGYGVGVGYLDAQEMADLNVVIGDNALLSAERISANFWGNLFPDLLDAPVTDVSKVIGLDIGGVTEISDWLVAAAAEVESVSPRQVTGGAGDDALVASELGGILIGGAGDNVLMGGAGRDLLVGGVDGDTMTGGGRGDTFSLSAPPKGGHAVDVITDLNFDAGDHIILGDGFPRGFFDDDLNPDNKMGTFAGDSGVILHDNADIEELLLSDNVTGVTTESGDLELRFDFDGYGGVDYVLRLEGYANDVGDGTDAADVDAPTDNDAAPAPAGQDILGTENGDRLVGTAAAELIDGLGGRDLYFGGGGGDILVMGDQDGDQFRGFDAAVDQLDLTAWGVQGLDELSIFERPSGSASESGASITIRDLAGVNVTHTFGENGLSAADFTAANFIFADTADLEVTGTSDTGGETLFGRAGNDRLDGGVGYNAMTGFGGDDVFVIGLGRGDIVKDFGNGADRLDLTAWGVSGLDELKITESAGMISISDSSWRLVRLERAETGLSAADLTDGSFIFADALIS